MSTEWIFIGAGLIGIFLLILGLHRLRGGKPFSGSLQGLIGIALIAGAAAAYLVALNLYTYHRFTHETPVVELRFKQAGAQEFRALFTPAEGNSQVFSMQGDEWQLDARVLKWSALGTLIGLDGVYRLERLGARFRDIQRERSGPHTVYPLWSGTEPGLDSFSLARRYGRWLPLIDTIYGSAAYLPMVDGAAFDISVGTQGLIARPVNDAAKKAVRDWR